MFTYNLNPGQTVPLIVKNTSHWVWQGTGLTNGASIPGVCGYEVDRLFTVLDGFDPPANISYTTLAETPFSAETQQSSIYQANSGAWVFAAGSLGWCLGLGGSKANAAIQKATANILARFATRATGRSTDDQTAPLSNGRSPLNARLQSSTTTIRKWPPKTSFPP
jgi:hypothetical protein